MIVVRGSEEDVLSRYALAAKKTEARVLVRITGDCPFTDPDLLDEMLTEFSKGRYDYYSNCVKPTYPDGLDIEIFTRDSLIIAHKECKDKKQREHVTPWIRENKDFRIGCKYHEPDYSNLRVTVDEPEDLNVIRAVVKELGRNYDFNWEEVVKLKQEKPHIFASNAKFIRNEGTTMTEGQKMWRRAKRAIPGGNMLLSKQAEMFLPGQWPAYFSEAKGCRVWDLQGRELIDMSIMGIGTNILGYGHPEVDSAVISTIRSGNMSTLNCPEEVLLAEKLIKMHPWAKWYALHAVGEKQMQLQLGSLALQLVAKP